MDIVVEVLVVFVCILFVISLSNYYEIKRFKEELRWQQSLIEELMTEVKETAFTRGYRNWRDIKWGKKRI